MGKWQNDFLEAFKSQFGATVSPRVTWVKGQCAKNKMGLPRCVELRRPGAAAKAETFEVGDLRGDWNGWTVMVECDFDGVSVQNLVKYWPYIRGDMVGRLPESPVIVLHFSDWRSYGSYRDLWKWALTRMQEDPHKKVEIRASQFDHWGHDRSRWPLEVQKALAWLEQQTKS